MSHWAHEPEYFDDWIVEHALQGKLGPVIQAKAEEGIEGYDLWDMLDTETRLKASRAADEDWSLSHLRE